MLDTEQSIDDRLVLMRRFMDQMEVSFCRLLAEKLESVSDTDQLESLAWECQMSNYALSQRVDIANHLPLLTQSISALAEGAIGFQHLSWMADTAQRVGEAKFSEKALLPKAKKSTVAGFRKACVDYRHRLDAKGMAGDEEFASEFNKLDLKMEGDGSLRMEGWFDPISGAVIRSALEPLAKPLGKDDDRNRERRMADALVELAMAGGGHAEVIVTGSMETFQNLPGADAASMEWGAPISSETARFFACGDSSVTRVILGTESAVIDCGRSKRVATPSQKRAMGARDGGCKVAGCTRPPTMCQPHHRKHWIDGGETNVGEMDLYCWVHHRRIHQGWKIVNTDEGRTLLIPPSNL